MTNFVERFEWQDIERSAGDDTAAYLLKSWHDNNKCLNNDILDISDRLLICGRPRDLHSPAPILISGKETLATKFFGADWSDRPDAKEEVMSSQYKALVATAYQEVDQSNEPVFDLVSTELNNFVLRYQRLILPFTAKNGIKFHICYSMLLGDLPLILKRSSDISQVHDNLQSTHHGDSQLRAG